MRGRFLWLASAALLWGCNGEVGAGAADSAPGQLDAASVSDAGAADAQVVGLAFAIHERSIGSAPGALADTGTMSGAADGMGLSLSGGTLPAKVGRGDRLLVNPGTAEEVVYYLAAREGDTELTIQTPLAATLTDAPYRLDRAFPSISAWSSATKGNLIAQKRREIGVCYNDSPFVENVVISGSTSDAMHYRVLTVAQGQRHSGLAGTGALLRPDTAGHGILVLEDFAQVEWLEVTDWSTNAGGSFDGINIKAEDVLIQYVIVHDDGHGVNLNSDAGGIQLERDLGTATVRNSVVYNLARLGIGTHSASGTTLHIENSTAFACTLADNNPDQYGCITSRGDNSVVQVRNVIALDAAGLIDFYAQTGVGASFGDLSSNNLSSDTSAPGANSIAEALTATVIESVTLGSEDLHLLDASPAVGTGLSLANEFDDDIDEELRGATWDIGADER
jgi:hypothetical protein